MTTFAEFFESEMRRLGYTNRTFADKARVSFKTLAEIRSGTLERKIQSGNLSVKKYLALSRSVTRVLLALDQNPKIWLEKLGLDTKIVPQVKNGLMQRGVRFESLYEEALTEEDLKALASVQAILGQVLTVHMALEIVDRIHSRK